MEYKREPQKFLYTGVDISHPVDLLPPGKSPYSLNVRSYQEGVVEPRTGVSKINADALAELNITSIARMNDYVLGNFIRFVGAGLGLYGGTNAFTLIESGFSGDPLSVVPYRPDQSARVWAYIANYNKMRKVNTDLTSYTMGVFPPTVPPTCELLRPNQSRSLAFDEAAGWTDTGDAGGSTTADRLTGVSIGDIKYITGSTGWAVVRPSGGNYYDINPGMLIRVNTGGGSEEIAVVQEVHKAVTTGCTIASIAYDSGTTGPCTIVPSTAIPGLRRNTLLKLGSGPEVVRVESITNGPDGSTSFRTTTVGTLSATNTIIAPTEGNFWIYFVYTHAAGETLQNKIISTAYTFSSGVGQSYKNLAAPDNFATINVSASRPVTPDDYIHLSIKVDRPDRLVEGKVFIDIDKGTTNVHAATDFTRNVLIAPFRANDFQPLVRNVQTSDASRATAIQLQQQNQTDIPLDNQVAVSGDISGGVSSAPQDTTSTTGSAHAGATTQSVPGESQWTEFHWKVADLIRVGSAQSSDLSDIRAYQIQLTITGDISLQFGNFWVGGTYGPDTGFDKTPLLYRFRYRNSATGAVSLPGPAIRSGLQALRQAVSIATAASSDPQVDKVDIERLGGNLLEWHYVGTTTNGGTFVDDQFSSAIAMNSPLDEDAYMPFPMSDRPHFSQVNVSGTAVDWVSGDQFNTNWARGSEVIINGKLTSLYASPQSVTRFYIDDSLGNLTNVTLEIPEATIQGQPMPVMWGPYGESLLACGAPFDSGSVYFTKAGTPDSAPITHRIEVTTPTERMMNGCLYDGRCFAFSDKRMFFATRVPAPTYFTFTEVANGKGLAAIWALAVGPKIWFLSQDGIYESDGGTPVRISDDIAPLFPDGDRKAYAVNGLQPIAMDLAGAGTEAQNLRLCYHNGYLIFDYIDILGIPRTLIYDTREKSWHPDWYWNGAGGKAFTCHYSENGIEDSDEEARLLGGSNHGFVYQHTGTTDDGTAIQCVFRTPAKDVGDSRAMKVFGDLVVDLDAQGVVVTVTPYINNYRTPLASSTITNSSGKALSNPIDLNSGAGQFNVNLGIELAWTCLLSGAQQPRFYFWSPSYLERPEDTFLRADDWTDAGYPGAKLVRGFLVLADTSTGGAKSVKLQGDQADIQTFSMNHNGETLIAYALSTPAVASMLRLLPTTASSWRKFAVSYIYDKYPENAALFTPYDDGGYLGAKFVQGVRVEAAGTTPALVQYDGDQSAGVLTLAHPSTTLQVQPYSFASPFIAHQMRLGPLGPIRIGRVEWVWEPAPELVYHWRTQGTTHDIPGYQFLKDGYIAHISTQDIHLQITVDGTNYTFTIPNSGGAYRKTYLMFQGNPSTNRMLKGKLFEYYLYSQEPFRLFVRDSEIRVHAWAGGGYQVVRPFGDISRQSGARI